MKQQIDKVGIAIVIFGIIAMVAMIILQILYGYEIGG